MAIQKVFEDIMKLLLATPPPSESSASTATSKSPLAESFSKPLPKLLAEPLPEPLSEPPPEGLPESLPKSLPEPRPSRGVLPEPLPQPLPEPLPEALPKSPLEEAPKSPLSGEKIAEKFKMAGIGMIKDIISASGASILSVGITHPLDVIKFYFHYSDQGYKKRGGFYTNTYSSLFSTIRSIKHKNGLFGFYMNFMGAQRESLFYTVSMFYTKNRVHDRLAEWGLKDHPSIRTFISGFLSATFAVIVLNPIDEHAQRAKTNRKLLKQHGPIVAAYNLRQRMTLSNLYRGSFSRFMYLGTQYGVRFWIYDDIREFILEHKKLTMCVGTETNTSMHLNAYGALFAGAVSGIVADIVSNPFDVVNTRLKKGSLRRQQTPFQSTCRRYFQCIWLSWKQLNVKLLYAGLTPSLMKSMISNAITFAVYDQIGWWLEPMFDRPMRE